MSSERSSSAVRNLRSIFEVKGPDTSSPDTRGRSRSGLTESNNENSRPTSKVRASFVPVETTPSASVMASTEEGGLGHVIAGGKRESSAGLRRSSFSENGEDGEALLQLRKTVSQEAERRERDSKVPEAIPEHAATSAAVTPMMQPNTEQSDDVMQESPLAHRSDAGPVTPGKPTAAAGDSKKPHTPERKMAAVSGGDAEKTKQPEAEASNGIEAHEASASAEPGSATKKSKRAEQPKRKPTTNGKPTPISTKAAQKPSSSAMKSPASQPKTPTSAKATTPPKTATPLKTSLSAPTEKKQPSKKASRSSLTAPTAASVARAAAPDRSVSNSSKQSPPSKAKARQGTKPVDLPSRLTAPTAASRARHDAAPALSNGSAANGKPPTTTRPKPQPASTRPTPRSSMQGPDSRTSHPNKKPAAAPADGSFLERMMRPTAASSSKTHEKVEPKSPPRTKPAATVASKPKVNGHAKKAGVEKGVKGLTEDAQPAQEGGAEGGGGGGTAGKDAGGGIETPVSQVNGNASREEALETPAFGGGETIR
ncbi:hypothetical protein LTR12_006052 [Friedmanniomyces endolithicus]|nr:hypothetical protein LTR12_006052 [Friedmanniomyces endolithicus]